MVGASIGLTFALSLVLAPLLYEGFGMHGIFQLTAILALAGIAIVVWAVPAAPQRTRVGEATAPTSLAQVLRDTELMRLNVGIFSLHLVQMAMFVVLPGWLIERAGLPLGEHWKMYLPVVLASFVMMSPQLRWGERNGRVRAVFLGAVVLVLAVQLAFAAQPVGLAPFAVLLLLFFFAFNVLEALVPSMVSRLAPPDARGTALGVYNTTQALGLFAGGAVGGWAQSRFGGSAIFVACAIVMMVWLIVAAGARRWPAAQPSGRRAAAAH